MIGGKDDRQTLSSVEKLDCDTEQWSYVRAIPLKLFDHAAAVCDDKVGLLYIGRKKMSVKV